jgi:glycosyltransferase involved in cell wall biosynthesis
LNQTFSNYELIICDDGSTDGTEELLKEDYARYFKSGKFIYLKLEHYGVSKARNMGLKRSNGDLVAYLDSDNLWKPEFLEKMVGLFDSNPKFKSAYCALQAYNQVKNEHYILNSPYNRNKIVMGNYIDLNVFVHRRELYELFGGFNESLERLVAGISF